MKRNDIKRQIRAEATNFVPNNKEQIMSKLIIEPNRKLNIKKFPFSFKFSIAFTVLLVSIIGLSLILSRPVQASNSIISIEINPAFEVELDKKDNLIDIRGLNVDGVLVIESLTNKDWANIPYSDALNNIIEICEDLGYLDDNRTINIYAVNTNQKQEHRIANIVKLEIENTIDDRSLNINVRNNNDNQEIKDQAKSNKVSVGKMLQIKRVIEIDSNISLDDARKMTPKKLNEIINGYNKNKIEDFKDNYHQKFNSMQHAKMKINHQLTNHKNLAATNLRSLEKMIKNKTNKSIIETNLSLLLVAYDMNGYDFNPNNKANKYEYYQEVLGHINDRVDLYYNELLEMINNEIEVKYSNFNKYVREIIKENHDHYQFEFDFDLELDDIINSRGHGGRGK